MQASQLVFQPFGFSVTWGCRLPVVHTTGIGYGSPSDIWISIHR
ncbi:MAG: hypothetical protein ACK6AT_03605 [Planctomycetota bacterium]